MESKIAQALGLIYVPVAILFFGNAKWDLTIILGS
jgi:hypothetical protein